MAGPEPSYTVFIRLPFPRGDFVDPPPVRKYPSALWTKLTFTGGMGSCQRQGPVEDPLQSFQEQRY